MNPDPSILIHVSIPWGLYAQVLEDCRKRGCGVSDWFREVARAQFEDLNKKAPLERGQVA
jgi:hypothetical protein